jgi:hypothetical protein
MRTTLLTKPNGKDVRATFRIYPNLFWSLKQLALDKRTTTTELVNEALSDVLLKYGHSIDPKEKLSKK